MTYTNNNDDRRDEIIDICSDEENLSYGFSEYELPAIHMYDKLFRKLLNRHRLTAKERKRYSIIVKTLGL